MANTQLPTIEKFIAPLASVAQSDAEDSLGSALSLVPSSHEAVFIFNDENEFLGLVSPFRTLYDSNYPFTTKVSSIVLSPPSITEETPVYEVAEHMLATKIYAFIGFYSRAGEKKYRREESVRKYYTALVDSLPDTTPINEIVTHLITSPHNTTVLVDKYGNPTGFLSVRDLLQAVALLRPEEDIPLIMKKPNESVSDLAPELRYG